MIEQTTPKFLDRLGHRGPVAAGLLLLAAAVLAGCGTAFEQDGITYMYEPVVVREEVARDEATNRGLWSGFGRSAQNFDYEIFQVATIDPVVVGSVTTQANNIVIDGDTAVIAYNTAGAEFAGAIQVLDISNAVQPILVAEIPFPGVDITSINLGGDTLYFGGSISPDASFTSERSFLATLDLTGLDAADLQAESIDTDGVEFSSIGVNPTYFFTTGITRAGSSVYASSGAEPGAIFKMNADLTSPSELVESGADPNLFDIRDLGQYIGGFVALAGTSSADPATPSDGRILVFRGDTIREVETIPDFGSSDAKATIEVYSFRYAFTGLSEAGFQVFYLWDRDSDILESIYTEENPEVAWSTETATNSVTYSGDLVFTANGEAGFRVFKVTEFLLGDRPGDDWLRKIGFVPFNETLQPSGDYWSANHVEYRDESLFVASGLGGVAVYRIVEQ